MVGYQKPLQIVYPLAELASIRDYLSTSPPLSPSPSKKRGKNKKERLRLSWNPLTVG
jgi:hypothetical protein